MHRLAPAVQRIRTVQRPALHNQLSARPQQAHIPPGLEFEQIRLNSTSPSPTAPRKPSPYRLVPAHTFIAQFAPLHVAGWRLNTIPAAGAAKIGEKGMVDLQDRCLIRLYEFEQGKQGWAELMRFVGRMGEVVAAEDHHPRILITPAQDYVPSILTPTSPQSGYLLELSTHTHTPLPPSKNVTAGQQGDGPKLRPGVTTKDLRMAEALEGIWQDSVGLGGVGG